MIGLPCQPLTSRTWYASPIPEFGVPHRRRKRTQRDGLAWRRVDPRRMPGAADPARGRDGRRDAPPRLVHVEVSLGSARLIPSMRTTGVPMVVISPPCSDGSPKWAQVSGCVGLLLYFSAV
jgi:hypothetical protein